MRLRFYAGSRGPQGNGGTPWALAESGVSSVWSSWGCGARRLCCGADASNERGVEDISGIDDVGCRVVDRHTLAVVDHHRRTGGAPGRGRRRPSKQYYAAWNPRARLVSPDGSEVRAMSLPGCEACAMDLADLAAFGRRTKPCVAASSRWTNLRGLPGVDAGILVEGDATQASRAGVLEQRDPGQDVTRRTRRSTGCGWWPEVGAG